MKLELIKKNGSIVGYNLLTESEEEKKAIKILADMHRKGDNECLFSMDYKEGKVADKIEADDEIPADIMTFIRYKDFFTSEEELKVESVRTRNYGHIICVKCGGTNVHCDAQVYPNSGELECIESDACESGWCNDCHNNMTLIDIDSLARDLDNQRLWYLEDHKQEPQYALCDICYIANERREDVVIKLSLDKVEGQDDKTFAFCNGIDDIKKMVDPKVADYVVISSHRLYRIESNEEIF